MDILLDKNGDLLLNGSDIVLKNSVCQKINIRLRWLAGEWRWDDEAGMEYFEHLFKKNPDLDQMKELIEEQILSVVEVEKVSNVSIDIDSMSRKAVIRYEAATDENTYRGEVAVYG